MDIPIEEAIGHALVEMSQTLATAESCSGGLVAHRVTNVSGASAYFLGGVVAYSNKAKTELLGVVEGDLEQYGAVSAAVAQQMAEGVRAQFGADWGIGVTGIAGPSGGTPGKPVGLVYIGVAGSEETMVTRNEFSGGRIGIKEQTAQRALEMLGELIRRKPGTPDPGEWTQAAEG